MDLRLSERVYLDWNATAPLRPEARAAMIAALDLVGNPSSVHHEGRAARRLIEEARERVAALVGAEPRNVVFTSGGTEANMMALSRALETPENNSGFDRLMVSAVEHASVRAGGSFASDQVEEIPVTEDGVIDIAALERRLVELQRQGARPPLVSIMAANNETGVIQPVGAAAALVHAAGGMLHVDAVQVTGRIPFDIGSSGADLITVSAHKLGGPQGVGALIKRSPTLHLAEPLLINLDLMGFAVSSGSACSSGKVAASHVLAAMAVAGNLSAGAIRLSIGPGTRENEIDLFLKAWMKLLAGLSKGGKSGLAA